MRYLAIDPGKTTGWACYDSDTEKFTSGEKSGTATFYVISALTRSSDRIFVERFDPTISTKTSQPDAIRVTGMVEYAAWCAGGKAEFSPRSAAKVFATDAKLKALGWHRPSKGGHQNDAARHLLLNLMRRPEGVAIAVSLAQRLPA